MNKNITIIHLSDIHMKSEADADKYLLQLNTDLIKNLNINTIDYIVISGDIADFATEDEYFAATKFVSGIKDQFDIQKKNFIIVPGNHDLNWAISKQSYKDIDPVKEENLKNEILYKERFQNFSDQFYNLVCSSNYSLEYEKQSKVHLFPNHQLLFLTLNSSWKIDHHYQDRADINMSALSNSLQQIMDNQYNQWIKIAIWHHPILGKGMMENHFADLLSVHGFQICLHGHIHEPKKDIHFYDDNHKIHVLAAGTFGAPAKDQVPGIPLQYNVLLINPSRNSFTIKSRKKEKPNGSWSADARWGAKENPKSYTTLKLNNNFSNQYFQENSTKDNQNCITSPCNAKTLRNLLLKNIFFYSNERLNSLFSDSELNTFVDDLPEAKTKGERVDLTLAYLLDKKLDTGETGIQLLVQAIIDRTKENDSQYTSLLNILNNL